MSDQNDSQQRTEPDIETASEQASDREGPAVVSRRWLLLKAGMALNGLVGRPGRSRGAVSVGASSKGFVVQIVGFARRCEQLSRGGDAACVL